MSKLASLHELQKQNLPIVPFALLDAENYKDQIKAFLKEQNLEKFMIRTDGKGNFSPSVVGVSFSEEVLNEVQEFFNEGYDVFVADPADKFKNFYSLNIQKEKNNIIVEIVGPGFIATDLNRHGFIHESYELEYPNLEIIEGNQFIISPELYEKEREEKINILREKETSIPEDALVFVYNTYPPFEEDKKTYVTSIIPRLVEVAKGLSKGKKEDFIASMSFLGELKQPVFWDVYVLG